MARGQESRVFAHPQLPSGEPMPGPRVSVGLREIRIDKRDCTQPWGASSVARAALYASLRKPRSAQSPSAHSPPLHLGKPRHTCSERGGWQRLGRGEERAPPRGLEILLGSPPQGPPV